MTTPENLILCNTLQELLDDEESGINLEDYSGPVAEWIMSPAVSIGRK